MKVPVYNMEGKQVKQIDVPVSLFDIVLKPEVVKQVIVAIQANQRMNYAHTKDRSEVSGGGRKPWKQKGTGRARAGSSRSPIWIGGGVTFGPRNNRNFSKKVNKKVRRLAIKMLLSDKVKNEKLFVIDNLEFSEIKTKKVVEFLQALPTDNRSTLILMPVVDEKIVKSVANIQKTDVMLAGDINAAELAKYNNVILSQEALQNVIDRFEN